MNPPIQVNDMPISVPSRAGQLQSRRTTRIPTVCVVDPQADDYQGWEESAEVHGVKLRIVASAVEALRFARTNVVELWIVNVQLPGLSGCELCRMLKDRSPATPVYLVADEYSPDLERAALRARATLFAMKSANDEWSEQWPSALIQ